MKRKNIAVAFLLVLFTMSVVRASEQKHRIEKTVLNSRNSSSSSVNSAEITSTGKVLVVNRGRFEVKKEKEGPVENNQNYNIYDETVFEREYPIQAMTSFGEKWLAINGALKNIVVFDLKALQSAPTVLKGHTGAVLALAASADGRLVSGAFDHTVKVWDCDVSKKPIASFVDDKGPYGVAALSNYIATGSENTIRIWDTKKTKHPVGTLIHSDLAAFTCLSGDHLISSSSDGLIKIWNINKLQEKPIVLSETISGVAALAALPDSRIAIGTSKGIITTLNLNTLHKNNVATGHMGKLVALSRMSDGRLLSASHDGIVKISDLSLQRKVVPLTGQHENYELLLKEPLYNNITTSSSVIQLWSTIHFCLKYYCKSLHLMDPNKMTYDFSAESSSPYRVFHLKSDSEFFGLKRTRSSRNKKDV